MEGQQVQISLLDQITNQPIAFANVLVEGLGNDSGIHQGKTTDFDGKVTFEINAPSKLTATFVGYKNLIDTIHPGETKTLKMEPTVYNVDEVVVTGQFRPETVDKSIYNIKVLGIQQIENKAATNLNDMLAGELNIRSTHDNSLGSSITMQGLGGEHIKYLVDGVPVIGRQNGIIDLEQLNLQNVDHIELIQGPMSVVYGSNALAGVINIIPKDPDQQKSALNGTAYYESVGEYDLTLGGSYAWRKNSISVYAGRKFFDGFDPVDTTRFQQWKPKLQYDVDATYMLRLKKTKIKFSGNYFYEEIRDKGNPLEVFNWDKAFDKYYFTDRWGVRAEINQQVGEKGLFNLMTAYSYYSKLKNTYLKDLTTLDKSLVPEADKQDTTRFDDILLRADFNNFIRNEKFKYQLGIDLNRESGYGKRIENNTQQIGDYAGFLSLILTPVPQLSIQPGVRAIYNTKYKAPLVYSLNVKWNLIEPLAIRASVAKGFRAPSLKELYLDFVDINHNIHGNPDLKAETSLNINMALNYNTQSAAAYNWGIDLGLFYNHIVNKISLAQLPSSDNITYSYINVDQYYTHGFDINFNNRIYPYLRLVIGFGVTGFKQYIEGANLDQNYVYTSNVTTQINYQWRLTGLNFSVFYKFNGLYPTLSFDGDSTVIAKTAAYNDLDINVGRWFWKRRINLQVGGKNLFNITNVDQTGNASAGGIHSGGGTSTPVNWGRTFFVKIQFSFNQ